MNHSYFRDCRLHQLLLHIPHRPDASLRSRRIFLRRGSWSFNFSAQKSRSRVESSCCEKRRRTSKTAEEPTLQSMPGPTGGLGRRGRAGDRRGLALSWPRCRAEMGGARRPWTAVCGTVRVWRSARHCRRGLSEAALVLFWGPKLCSSIIATGLLGNAETLVTKKRPAFELSTQPWHPCRAGCN